MYKANEINWLRSEKTLSVPYIFNNKQNKIKILTDGTILDLKNEETGTITHPVSVLSEYYDTTFEPAETTRKIVANRLNMLQFVLYYNHDVKDENVIINKFQLWGIKKAYDKYLEREIYNKPTNKQLTKEEKVQQEKEF